MAFDVRETILSQYSASPRLKALIIDLAKVLSPQRDINTFYHNIFNLYTAQGRGLDIWGRLVGIERNAQMVTNIGVPYLGFKAKSNEAVRGFDIAPFYHGAENNHFALSDDAYRLYILTKAAANVCTGSLYDLNKMLSMLLPRCKVKLYRVAPMHLKLVCNGKLKDYQKNMLLLGDLPPIPAGVKIDIVLNGACYFGFSASSNEGFNNGPFYQR